MSVEQTGNARDLGQRTRSKSAKSREGNCGNDQGHFGGWGLVPGVSAGLVGRSSPLYWMVTEERKRL